MVGGGSAPDPVLRPSNTEMGQACYDCLDAHLPHAADIGRASVPMGLLLAWCANLHLLSDAVIQQHERLLLRVRFREATGSELLIACGGNLSRDLFSAQGQRFLDRYYVNYMAVFCDVFGKEAAVDCYEVADNWANYDQLAVVLTRAYMGKPKPASSVFGRLARWLKR
jgi:hypothetical protein